MPTPPPSLSRLEEDPLPLRRILFNELYCDRDGCTSCVPEESKTAVENGESEDVWSRFRPEPSMKFETIALSKDPL